MKKETSVYIICTDRISEVVAIEKAFSACNLILTQHKIKNLTNSHPLTPIME